MPCRSFLEMYLRFDKSDGATERTWRNTDMPEKAREKAINIREKTYDRPSHSAIVLQADPISKKAEIRDNISLFFIKDFTRPIIAEKKMIKEETVAHDVPAFLIESTREKVCSDLIDEFFEKWVL